LEYIFTPLELVILIVAATWVVLNYLAFRGLMADENSILRGMYSYKQLRFSLVIFSARFIISFLLLAKTELFPVVQLNLFGFDLSISLSIIIFLLIWVPEIITLVLWGIIFSVFALAGLGAALFLDYLYFSDMTILWGKVGPIGLIMMTLIILSFRYFSNYSIREIINMARNRYFLRGTLLFSSVAYMLIGGGVLWRGLIKSRIYRNSIAPILDRIETATTAISVLIILLTLPFQFPTIPIPIRILIIINVPIAFSAVIILLRKGGFRAWKAVFEIYTEEFAMQSLIVKDKIKRPKLMLIALIGNWAAIPIALYDVGITVYWLIGDLILTIIALIILGSRYISSMIRASKEIIGEIRAKNT